MKYKIINHSNNIEEIKIKNNIGFLVSFLNLGATIKDIHSKDKNGVFESVVMHPLNVNEFIKTDSYYGKTIGRFSGRINYGKFELNDKIYQLELNDNEHNCLHGGSNGFSELIFNYSIKDCEDKITVLFTSKSVNDGFPGIVDLEVSYTLYENSQVIDIEYFAISNEDTVLNLTNHTYFNLSGFGKRNILKHELFINSSKYTNLDNYLITKSIDEVNSVMDFRKFKYIGNNINDSFLKKHAAFGYDHYWLFDDVTFSQPNVILKDEASGRELLVYTTYPGVVVYSCNYPRGEEVQIGHNISLHDSVCLECQFIPNGINMPDFKNDVILQKNKRYNNKIRFEFK